MTTMTVTTTTTTVTTAVIAVVIRSICPVCPTPVNSLRSHSVLLLMMMVSDGDNKLCPECFL